MIKISQQLTVCVYLITALWITNVFAHNTQTLPAGIEVTLELPQAEVGASDQILLTMIFRNITGQPIRVLPYDTGLDGGVTGEFLEILKGITPIPYSGRISKFAPPRESDLLTIAPGQSIRHTVNLEAAYSLGDEGNYSIRYVAAEMPSNTVSLTLTEKRVVASQRAKNGFNFCTANHISTIESDLVVAEQVARIALDDLTEAPVAQRASAPRYVEWFGAYTPARYAEVEQTFEAVVNVLENDQSDYFCRTNAFEDDPMFGCRTNEIGFVFANDAFNVNLCLFYFNLPQRIGNVGSDGRVATIVHELSHFRATGNTLDTTLSIRNVVKDFARTNPSLAINNAPNIEFFVENMPALTMPRPAPPAPPKPAAGAFLPAIISLLSESGTSDEASDVSVTFTGQCPRDLSNQVNAPFFLVSYAPSLIARQDKPTRIFGPLTQPESSGGERNDDFYLFQNNDAITNSNIGLSIWIRNSHNGAAGGLVSESLRLDAINCNRTSPESGEGVISRFGRTVISFDYTLEFIDGNPKVVFTGLSASEAIP